MRRRTSSPSPLGVPTPVRFWQGQIVPRDLSFAAIREMLSADPPACWVAFGALGERSDDLSMEILIAESSSLDPFRRRAAVQAIAEHGQAQGSLPIVRSRLSDPSRYVVRSAIEAVAKLRDSEGHDQVIELLKDRDPATRNSVLWALDELWQTDDFEVVLLVARKDPARSNRRQASFALVHHADERGWRRLVQLWLTSEIPQERVWACNLAGQFGSASDRGLVERLISDPDGHVRKAAERALRSSNLSVETPPLEV